MADTTLLPRPMSIDEFVPLVGRAFQVDCTPNTVTITLTDATLMRATPGAANPSFSLIFRSAPEVLLVSGTYAMQSGRFGPAAIHLAPVVSPLGSAPGYTYQAVFN